MMYFMADRRFRAISHRSDVFSDQQIRQLESIRSTETPNLEDFRQALAKGLEQEVEIKKSILRDLIASIEVHADGKLEINYRIPMGPGLKNIPRTRVIYCAGLSKFLGFTILYSPHIESR